MKIHENNAWGELGAAIGKGVLAGLAGTAAITISQMIEMSVTKRKSSDAPVKVAQQVINIKPAKNDTAGNEQLSQEIHWAYGTVWGISRGLIGLTGLKGIPASLVHFAAIWGTSMVMLPKFKISPPVHKQDAQTVAIDGLHHAVYALATGLAYDAFDRGGRHERKFKKVLEQLKLKGVLDKIK
jgi:hypothetical protein